MIEAFALTVWFGVRDGEPASHVSAAPVGANFETMNRCLSWAGTFDPNFKEVDTVSVWCVERDDVTGKVKQLRRVILK